MKMAKSTNRIMFQAYAVCFLSLLGLAYGGTPFIVEGRVYCDTCRVEFITKAIKYIQGATVQLECKDREGGAMTYSQTGVTDASGTYHITVSEEHEEEICDVYAVNSPDPECNEASKRQARITLTHNVGIATATRLPNPICFLKKQPLPECPQILRDLDTPSVPAN